MILPDKYVKPSESLMYLSSIVIKYIDNKECNITDLWLEIKKDNTKLSYNKFLQILVYLYTIGVISYTEKGEIFNENYRS